MHLDQILTLGIEQQQNVSDPVVTRLGQSSDVQSTFRMLLMSKRCYGNLGVPVACPKTKGRDGFELSQRPWRDSPLDDLQALALTPITNKQLLRYLRGDGDVIVKTNHGLSMRHDQARTA